MHIKSITLDGFKSYQKHTEITGFSETFNAITGYNGSGKSNVLDSICFILGISKLDNIRAKSMAELISHGGTKATVQIRFDNRDKMRSPNGYERCDEIVVQRTITAQASGKGCATNYTINGTACTNARIRDFFQQIGLNVNNPHFLIMQGRITTVLNMKPEEILGMVEEAAGTRMYDEKKRETEKTMATKEHKIKEIDNIFSVSIDPRMEKFREDRKNMVEVTRLTKLKENAQRKHEGFTYYQTLEHAKRDTEMSEKVKLEIEDLGKRVEEIKAEIVRKEEEKKALEANRPEKDGENGLQDAYRAKTTEKMKSEAEKSRIVEGISKLRKDQERIEKSLIKDRKGIEMKRKELEETKSKNEQEINQYKDDESKVTKYRNDLESLTRGTVANEQGEHVSIEHEIQESRTKSAALEAELKTNKNRRERLKARISKLTKEREVLVARSSTEIADMEAIQKQIDELNARIAALGFDADSDIKLKDRVSWLKLQIREIEEANRQLTMKEFNGRFYLSYTPPPIPNFNAKRDIIGLIAHLCQIKPGSEKYAPAVEVGIGGLLGQIVVRDQDIARILIDSKAFVGRRTLIPMSENNRSNERAQLIPDRVLNAARRVASRFNQDVTKLIDHIVYPEYINNTFISYLGQILVVDTLDCARAVAYDNGVRMRTVSMRGDDVKPTGVMTGGFSETLNQSTLLTFAPMHERRIREEEHMKELEKLEVTMRKTERIAQQYQDLNRELVNAQRKLDHIRTNMKNSALGVVQKDFDEATIELKALEAEIETKSRDAAELYEKVKTLETMKNNDKDSHDQRKRELTAMLQRAEKNAEQNKDRAEKAKRAVMQIAATVDDLEQSIKNDEIELEQKKKETEELEAQLPVAQADFDKIVAEEQAALAKVDEFKSEQRQMNTRVGKLGKEADMLRKEETKTKAKIEEKEKEATRLFESEKANQKHAQTMLKKCEWLVDEQVHFNKKGGLYDFDGYSLNRGVTEIKDLADRIEKLERCLCMKNVSNLDTCEAKVMDIKNKREKLSEDFDMLRRTMKVLDKKKVDELMRAHESVNQDFGKIFNCLLPDANACLVPPEGKSVTQGLEVKVSFNGVVKESLQELSGGQRSLVALSLILAMLKFKPAPLYILDEVDAALDLSHTANIGVMIRKHFTNSQFIIVSLKQGMFSNADVLFQTHFADGHSTCTRLTGAALEKAKNDAKLAKQALEVTDEPETSKKTKKGAKTASSSSTTDI